MSGCAAVIFDMDGIIVDSESSWERARLAVVARFGGTYHPAMARDLMGMTPPEWSHCEAVCWCSCRVPAAWPRWHAGFRKPWSWWRLGKIG